MTASAPSYRFASVEPGYYELITPYEESEYRVKMGLYPAKKLEIGFNLLARRPGIEVIGTYAKLAPFDNKAYLMLEYDHNRIFEDGYGYARLGSFIYRGFDVFYELDSYINGDLSDHSQAIGLSWNPRPRFNISFKINLDQNKYNQYQVYGWL